MGFYVPSFWGAQQPCHRGMWPWGHWGSGRILQEEFLHGKDCPGLEQGFLCPGMLGVPVPIPGGGTECSGHGAQLGLVTPEGFSSLRGPGIGTGMGLSHPMVVASSGDRDRVLALGWVGFAAVAGAAGPPPAPQTPLCSLHKGILRALGGQGTGNRGCFVPTADTRVLFWVGLGAGGCRAGLGWDNGIIGWDNGMAHPCLCLIPALQEGGAGGQGWTIPAPHSGDDCW